MRLIRVIVAALLLSACNLSSSPVATPTTAPASIPPQPQPATAAPSLTPLPGVNATAVATRTPFGSSPPTVQSIAPTGQFPTPATGERAEISGTAVDGSTLMISGVVHNLSEDKFTLQVFDANDQPISSEQTITLSNPNHVADVPWSASVMVRGYTGAAQIRISATLADGTTGVVGTAAVNITPSTPSGAVQPVSGATVIITAPANDMSVSLNPIIVTGTAGGMADNQFTLLLLDASGTVINSQVITLTGAETNAVPWSASMGTSSYRGRAEIRAVVVSGGQQVTIGSVTVNLQ
jgi:hypothetical protein